MVDHNNNHNDQRSMRTCGGRGLLVHRDSPHNQHTTSTQPAYLDFEGLGGPRHDRPKVQRCRRERHHPLRVSMEVPNDAECRNRMGVLRLITFFVVASKGTEKGPAGERKSRERLISSSVVGVKTTVTSALSPGGKGAWGVNSNSMSLCGERRGCA